MPARSHGPLFVALAAAVMLGCAGYLAVKLESQSSTPEAAAALARFHQ